MFERLKTFVRKRSYATNLPIHSFRHNEYSGQNFDAWLLHGIAGYQQWYQCVDFGNGIVAHVTTPPEWKPDPSLDASSGMDRFDFIIRPNLPDVSGLRVLDLGCNVGLYSLAVAKMGAREVVGVDRDLRIRQRTGQLPFVDLVSQAEFVKSAFEIRDSTKYPVIYKAIDFQNLDDLRSLGTFDLILALNVVYHELDRAPKLIEVLGEMSKQLLLQSSLVHPSPISEWAKIETNIAMLMSAGFDKITIDCPVGYLQPVIRAAKTI